MLPIQIMLEGFMSYRDKTTLDFSSATLWLLWGRNGAGKSTVFDAIKYALFGTHRNGTTGAGDLINHNCETLRVAFDFGVGERVYRVTRTLNKRGRPTMGASLLRSPDSDWERALPETTQRDGFNAWRDSVLGLDEATFTASTMLQQGRADALLEAAPVERFKMLAQIVDLSKFEALHEKSETRRKSASEEAARVSAQLQTLRVIAPDELAASRARLQISVDAQSEVAAQLDALNAAFPRAQEWEKLQRALQSCHADLEACRALLSDELRLETDAERLRQLDAVLPALQNAASNGARLRDVTRREELARASVERATNALRDLQTREEHARAQRDELRDNANTARTQRERANETQLRLNPLLRDFQTWLRLTKDETFVAEQLRALPSPDAAHLQNALEIARVAERALPIINRLRQLHAAHEVAERDQASGHAARDRAETTLQTATQTRLSANAARDEASAQESQTRAEEASAKTRLQSAQNALLRFETVEGEALCGYCGQELTPEHRDFERERLTQELQNAQIFATQATLARQNAAHALQTANRELEAAETAQRRAESNCRAASEALRLAARDISRTQKDAREARAELSPAWNNATQNNAPIVDASNAATSNANVANANVANGDVASAIANGDAPRAGVVNAEIAFAHQVQGGVAALNGAVPRADTLNSENLGAASSNSSFDAAHANSSSAAIANTEVLSAEVLNAAQQRARDEAARLPELRAQDAARQAAELERARLLQRARELSSEVASVAAQLQSALGEAPTLERADALRSEAEAAKHEASEAQSRERELHAPTRALENQCDALTREIEVARETSGHAARALTETGSQREEIARNLQAARANLPLAWAQSWQQSHDEGSALLWETERDALRARDAFGALQRLQEARAIQKVREEQNAELQAQLETIPLQARRAANDVQVEIEGARQELSRANDEREVAANTLRDDELAHQAHETAAREANASARERDLFKLLSDALGREGLQRKLLLEAERAIVDGANDVLDRLSGGSLRLALPVEGSGRDRALDLVAFDSHSGDGLTAIPIAFLSGSQKFRVCVALAIGIGNAGGGSRRVESVIIDEGFGSLDREGRDAMLDELRALGQVLQRVIVVSHQDDFAEGFSHRYHIVQRDGSSRALREAL